jgi:predicted RecA/RadA family phage recombinase
MSNATGQRDNFSNDISVTAATGGYTAGQIYLIADSYFVARETASAGAACLMALCNDAIWVTKSTGTGKSFVVGDKVYVKSNKAEPATSTGAVLLNGTVIAAASTSDTKVLVQFHGGIAPTAT